MNDASRVEPEAEVAARERRTAARRERARMLADRWTARKLAIAAGATATPAEVRRIRRDAMDEERKAERFKVAAERAERRVAWRKAREEELTRARLALVELGAPDAGRGSAYVYEKTACQILGTTVTRLRRLGLPTTTTANPHYRSANSRLYSVFDLLRAKREHADVLRKQPRPDRAEPGATERAETVQGMPQVQTRRVGMP